MKGDFFHIVNRGVEKRKIFITKNDYLRFIHNLYDFNNKDNVDLSYFHRRQIHNYNIYGSATSVNSKEEIVNVLCWCLIPNHLHLLVQEKLEKGASMFTKKLTGGYTLYFNLQNDRSGVLFQGRSKIISVTRDAHFIYLPYYILSSPIGLIEPHWKEKGIKNFKKVIEFLENYKYSSFPDLNGKENFPFVINKNLFYKLFNTNKKQFREDFLDWLKNYKGQESWKFED